MRLMKVKRNGKVFFKDNFPPSSYQWPNKFELIFKATSTTATWLNKSWINIGIILLGFVMLNFIISFPNKFTQWKL